MDLFFIINILARMEPFKCLSVPSPYDNAKGRRKKLFYYYYWRMGAVLNYFDSFKEYQWIILIYLLIVLVDVFVYIFFLRISVVCVVAREGVFWLSFWGLSGVVPSLPVDVLFFVFWVSCVVWCVKWNVPPVQQRVHEPKWTPHNTGGSKHKKQHIYWQTGHYTW